MGFDTAQALILNYIKFNSLELVDAIDISNLKPN